MNLVTAFISGAICVVLVGNVLLALYFKSDKPAKYMKKMEKEILINGIDFYPLPPIAKPTKGNLSKVS